jgi:hypothetical protein
VNETLRGNHEQAWFKYWRQLDADRAWVRAHLPDARTHYSEDKGFKIMDLYGTEITPEWSRTAGDAWSYARELLSSAPDALSALPSSTGA